MIMENIGNIMRDVYGPAMPSYLQQREDYWSERWQWCVERGRIMYVTLEEYREIVNMPLNLNHSWKVYRNRLKVSISIISRKAAAQRRQFNDSKGRSSN